MIYNKFPFIGLRLIGLVLMLSGAFAMIIGPPYRLYYQAFLCEQDTSYLNYRLILCFGLYSIFIANLFFGRKNLVLEKQRDKLKTQVKYFISLNIGIISFIFIFVYLSIPALAYPFAIHYALISSKISKINNSPGSRSGCRAGILISFNQDTNLFSEVCLNKEDGSNLKQGDTLNLAGWHIPNFGTYVEQVRK